MDSKRKEPKVDSARLERGVLLLGCGSKMGLTPADFLGQNQTSRTSSRPGPSQEKKRVQERGPSCNSSPDSKRGLRPFAPSLCFLLLTEKGSAYFLSAVLPLAQSPCRTILLPQSGADHSPLLGLSRRGP